MTALYAQPPRPFTGLSAALVLTALVAGCSVPPAKSPPAPNWAAQPYRHASGASAVDEGAWWRRLGDPVLVSLVERAAIANLDVQQALERAAAARAGESIQASRLWPSIDLTGSASDERTGLPDAVKQGSPDTKAHRVGVELAWEIDLAGGVRTARRAAQADASAAQAAVAGARLIAVGEVARQYFVLRGAQERLRIVDELATAQRETARLVGSREQQGMASRFDRARAIGEANALDAQVPPLRALVGASQSRIAVLLGENPSTFTVEGGSFRWPVPHDIGNGQPSDLLRRRPDLLAAEARFSAEALRVHETRVQWWPRLFLSALGGRQDLQLNALHLSPVRYSSVALAFAMPLLDGGRIEAEVQMQTHRSKEVLAAWQGAVLVAVAEVEDSLLTRSQELLRAVSLVAAADARRQSLVHAQSLRREGQIDLLALLDVQRSVLVAELALAESRTQQALNDVQLYRALGGGWSVADHHAAARAGAAS
jgi:NodT family efflux transporter outer membrane factor (OMF) lipoprotein